MKRLPSRVLATLLLSFIAFALALPACFQGSECGSCDQATEFCIGTANVTTGCVEEFHCNPLPPKCPTPPTCACLIGETNPMGRLLSCGFNSKIGFTVHDDQSGC